MFNSKLWQTSGHWVCASFTQGLTWRPETPVLATLQRGHVRSECRQGGVWSQTNELPRTLRHLRFPGSFLQGAPPPDGRVWCSPSKRGIGRFEWPHPCAEVRSGRYPHFLHAKPGMLRALQSLITAVAEALPRRSKGKSRSSSASSRISTGCLDSASS